MKQIVNTDGIKELIPELKRIGNNLNQIAKRCNEGGMLPSEAVGKTLSLIHILDNGEKYGFPSNILMQGYYWEEMTDINQETPRYLWNGCYSCLLYTSRCV